MSNGAASISQAATKPENFFENVENRYNHTRDRLADFSTRIHGLCDRMNGVSPPEDCNVEDIAKPGAYFDRCAVAEDQLTNKIQLLDDAICRLEQLGLL